MSNTPSLSKLNGDSNYGFDGKDVKLEQGKQRGLFSFLTEGDRQWLVYVTIVSFIVRLAFLSHPSVVIFDEVHFGGFAQKYLKREFFQDLHPPLARLLVTLSAWVGRFDAKFSFYNIGADYIKAGVPYVTMRAFTAVSGAVVPAIAFVTIRAMNLSFFTSLAVATMLIFDNGFATQSRLILLDSYLVLFTTLVAFFWVLFQRQRER
jgi:dolichyl-phosphate-mannose-protein mannosyltransferase